MDNNTSFSSIASSLSTFDPSRQSHLDNSLVYVPSNSIRPSTPICNPSHRFTRDSILSDSSSEIGLGLNMENDDSYLQTNITFNNKHRSYPSQIDVPSSPIIPPSLSPTSSLYSPRTPAKVINAFSTPTAITTGNATGTTIGTRSNISPTIYSPATDYSPDIEMSLNSSKLNKINTWNTPTKRSSKSIEIPHPINSNMSYILRKRELDEQEQQSIRQSLDDDTLTIHGLVPIYSSPNIDSLSSFPYKNSLTPPLITRTLSWHTNDTESSLSSREALVRFDDEPQIFHTHNPSISIHEQEPTPAKTPTSQHDYINKLSPSDILNWRGQYPRDITIASMLRTSNSNQNIEKIPAPNTPPTLYAAGFPILPDLPFKTKHTRYQAIKRTTSHHSTSTTSINNDLEKFGEYEDLNPHGLPTASKITSRFILIFCTLFPPLLLLFGTGYFDRVIGVVPKLEKRIALLLALIFFLIIIACIAIGLDLGTTH